MLGVLFLHTRRRGTNDREESGRTLPRGFEKKHEPKLPRHGQRLVRGTHIRRTGKRAQHTRPPVRTLSKTQGAPASEHEVRETVGKSDLGEWEPGKVLWGRRSPSSSTRKVPNQ